MSERNGTPRVSSPTWFERCLYNVKININSDVREKRAVEGASPYRIAKKKMTVQDRHFSYISIFQSSSASAKSILPEFTFAFITFTLIGSPTRYSMPFVRFFRLTISSHTYSPSGILSV